MKAQVIPTFLPNQGINLDKPEEMLKEVISPYSRNMEFYNERLQGRLGIEKFDTAALSGAVLLIDQFWQFDETWDLMVATKKDIYKYNFSNSNYDILTPTYTAGTITLTATGTSTAVQGDSACAWATNLGAGDYIKLGTGNVNTDAAWYEIESITNESACVIADYIAAAATGASQSYVARTIFQGADTNYWRAVNFQDSNLSETWIATNGVDTPVRYSGTGQVTPLATVPTGFTTARYIDVYKDRIIFAWSVEGGANQPQRVRWSQVANCESWDDLHFQDFLDETSWITGLATLSDYLVVFKEDNAYVGRYINPTDIYDFEKSTSCVGCKAQNSVVESQNSLFYYGSDNSFHRWNIVSDINITPDFTADVKNFDPNLEEYVYGKYISERKQIRWFVPVTDVVFNNQCYVYSLDNGSNQIWEYVNTAACSCIGSYLNTTDLYVDDTIWGEYYVDEREGFWDDRTFLDNAPIVLYGGSDGYVRRADQGTKDDDVAYSRKFRTVRMNYGSPNTNKRIWKQQWWFDAENTGVMTLKIKKDDKNDWETDTKTISLIDTTKDKIKTTVTWDKEAQNFQYQLETSSHCAFYGFLNFIFPKKRSI